jgi:putative FmdB family regulatory protein
MPTYEYACENSHTWETVQRISDEPIKECSTCGAPAKRLISASSFQLSGGGWGADLYGSSPPVTKPSGGSGEGA